MKYTPARAEALEQTLASDGYQVLLETLAERAATCRARLESPQCTHEDAQFLRGQLHMIKLLDPHLIKQDHIRHAEEARSR